VLKAEAEGWSVLKAKAEGWSVLTSLRSRRADKLA
jgi:hypothetical protein